MDFIYTAAQASFAFPARRSGPATLAQEVSTIFGLYPSSLARSAGFFSLTGKASLVSISGTFLFPWDRVFIYRWSSNFLKKVALPGVMAAKMPVISYLVPPTLCSSRKYPYPSPHEGQRIFRGERGPKGCNLRGGGGGFLRIFPGAPSKTGELSKTNSCSVEEAISYFAVNGLLKQKLYFSSMIF